ncbi:septum site-determining protein Ssd [Fodinicola feengrottensis]|uniref:septum site-determining protein Ssd n=1 Tax=Fodinicola feengrottensis TaxID=435914 RepID=UPI002441BD63|nr:septum site-determining protein Ssd [Fodinicola feengrottensis]
MPRRTADPWLTELTHRPLLVFESSALLDDMLRLAAAACTETDVVRDAPAALPHWKSAPLVVLDATAAELCAEARFPRREQVVVVTDRTDDSRAWDAAARLGADHVMPLPASQSWLVDRMAAISAGPSADGRVVSVVGGRGGAGATVLAAGLAVTALRAGLRPLLVDADPLGGGIDLALGGEETAGLRWPDLTGQPPGGRLNAPSLLKALPRVGELCVLSWDRSDVLEVDPAAVRAVLEAGRRGRDLVVVDLPRRPDEATTAAVQASDTVLLVVPAEVRGCAAAAARMAKVVQPHCSDLRVVVRGPAPAGLRSRDLGRALGLPLAGVLRPEPGLAAALERGEPPAGRGAGPLAEVCRSLLSTLDMLPMEVAA